MRLPVRYLMVPVAPPRSLVAAGAERASARSCAFAAGEGLFPKTLCCSLSVEGERKKSRTTHLFKASLLEGACSLAGSLRRTALYLDPAP